jgi:hypothetical protein
VKLGASVSKMEFADPILENAEWVSVASGSDSAMARDTLRAVAGCPSRTDLSLVASAKELARAIGILE